MAAVPILINNTVHRYWHTCRCLFLCYPYRYNLPIIIESQSVPCRSLCSLCYLLMTSKTQKRQIWPSISYLRIVYIARSKCNLMVQLFARIPTSLALIMHTAYVCLACSLPLCRIIKLSAKILCHVHLYWMSATHSNPACTDDIHDTHNKFCFTLGRPLLWSAHVLRRKYEKSPNKKATHPAKDESLLLSFVMIT